MKGKSNLVSKFRAAVVGAVSLAIAVSATAVSVSLLTPEKLTSRLAKTHLQCQHLLRLLQR